MTSRRSSKTPPDERISSRDSFSPDTPLQETPARLLDAKPSAFVIRVTAIASLGGILFGFDLGIIAVALPTLTETFALSDRQQEVVVSILYLGGGIGAALGGSLCDTFGRRRAILITDIVFLIGALILYFAPTYGAVVIGRVVVGFAVAVSGIADVSYLHEIAPVKWRGSIVSVNEACISLGFLFAFAVGSVLSYEGFHEAWRPMFGLSGFVAILQFAGMWYMPESPIWLKENGKFEESEQALQRMYSAESMIELGTQRASRSPGTQYDAIPAVGSNDTNEEQVLYGTLNTGLYFRAMYILRSLVTLLKQFQDFLLHVGSQYRRQSYIALFLAITQQLCGQTNVLSYSLKIFDVLGSNSSNQILGVVQRWSPLVIGLFKFSVTVVVIWKIERIGRRKLLLRGLSMISSGLLMLTFTFAGNRYDNVNDNANSNTSDGGASLGFALLGIILVVCGYSMSYGPLTWLLTSELYPTEVRGRALGASTIVTYFCAWLTTSTFLTLQRLLGSTLVFLLYFGITASGTYFSYRAIPDTGEKSTEEIASAIDEMPWWTAKNATEGYGMAQSENELS